MSDDHLTISVGELFVTPDTNGVRQHFAEKLQGLLKEVNRFGLIIGKRSG